MKKILFTSLIFVLGLSAAHATKRYVGFGTPATGDNLRNTLALATPGKDTVYVAAGVYNSGNAPFVVAAGVKLIGGYAKNDSATLTRRYPGQFMFLPTSSSDLTNTTEFTVLDGNSLKTKASDKHRVLKVEGSVGDTGVVDGCLIRNGHVRNGNGGGVLLEGGKLYNSIVRGNVAIADHPDRLSYDPETKVKTGAFGGGVYITNNGEMVNCLVAYNMANDGFGVVIGSGGGKTINNTVTANTYAPSFAKIEGAEYQMYSSVISGAGAEYRGINAKDSLPKWAPMLNIPEFFLSRTLTTESQYAVFCAAIDIVPSGDNETFYGTFSRTSLLSIDLESGGSVNSDYPNVSSGASEALLTSNAIEEYPGLKYNNGIWHPHADTLSMEYPMGNVSWYGALAYSVWLGGGLPTEAQWEYAARRNPAGITPVANENLYSGAHGTTSTVPVDTWRILDSVAWLPAAVSIDTASAHTLGIGWGDRVHEVARKRPNAVGLYDMTGLMKEWCADAPAAIPPYGTGSSISDPAPAGVGDPYDARVVRGGSWNPQTTENLNRSNFALSHRESLDIATTGGGGDEEIGFRPFISAQSYP